MSKIYTDKFLKTASEVQIKDRLRDAEKRRAEAEQCIRELTAVLKKRFSKRTVQETKE